jgi:hypothetical protein
LLHLAADGKLKVDRSDEITAETLVTLGGRVVHPRVCEALGVPPPGPEWKAASAKQPADPAKEEDGREAPDVYGIQSDADRRREDN